MKQIIFALIFIIPIAVFADVDKEIEVDQKNVLEATVKTLQNLI